MAIKLKLALKREGKREGRPGPRLALNPNPAAVGFDELAGDG
jgi:hypothetical protein